MGVDHISSPCIGWTLGEPFFALRTCSRPVASSTCDHCRSHNSDARKPWHRSGYSDVAVSITVSRSLRWFDRNQS